MRQIASPWSLVCETCGNDFRKTRPGRRYCSRRCAWRGWAKTHDRTSTAKAPARSVVAVFTSRYNAALRPQVGPGEAQEVARAIGAAVTEGYALDDLAVLPLVAAADDWYRARSADGSLRWRWLFVRGDGVESETGLPRSKHMPRLIARLNGRKS